MKFLCDVHISYKLVRYLNSLGFETIHVNNILDKSQTKDSEICKYADRNNFIVISKDSDFRNSHFVGKTPKKLIKINLGNISNQELIGIFSANIGTIEKLYKSESFLMELDKEIINLIEL